MRCPRCNCDLETTVVDDIEVDVCLSCKGIWFDDDELRQAKDISEPDANWMDFDIFKHHERFKIDVDEIKCPGCSRRMCSLKYDATEIVIDACPSCKGVWLDEAELGHIIEALNNEIDSKPFEELVVESIKEGIEIFSGPESMASEWKDLKKVLYLVRLRLYVQHPKVYEAMEAIQRSSPII